MRFRQIISMVYYRILSYYQCTLLVVDQNYVKPFQHDMEQHIVIVYDLSIVLVSKLSLADNSVLPTTLSAQ